MTFDKIYLDEYCSFSDEHKTLIWKKAPSNRCVIGKPVGVITKDGYYRTSHKLVHRLVWIYFNGEEPNGSLDHINGDRTDNRIENLRIASPLRNSWNRINAKGYTYCAKRKKYIAQIKENYKAINLGYFNTANEAKTAYLKAKQKRDSQ